MHAAITVAKILVAFVPMAVRVGQAMRKDSPGGKKITAEEWLTILLDEADPTLERVNALVKASRAG